MFIAEDLTQFKTLFVNKLKNMLSDDELGAFILVLANSHQDAFLQNELQEDLKSTFLALKDSYKAGNLKSKGVAQTARRNKGQSRTPKVQETTWANVHDQRPALGTAR